MQQIPADNTYRNCFIPNYEDYVFVACDYSSQELCLIAHDSLDPVWNECLRKQEDLHSTCAELLFGKDWTDAADEGCAFISHRQKCSCKKHKKMRDFAKTLNLVLLMV